MTASWDPLQVDLPAFESQPGFNSSPTSYFGLKQGMSFHVAFPLFILFKW